MGFLLLRFALFFPASWKYSSFYTRIYMYFFKLQFTYSLTRTLLHISALSFFDKYCGHTRLLTCWDGDARCFGCHILSPSLTHSFSLSLAGAVENDSQNTSALLVPSGLVNEATNRHKSRHPPSSTYRIKIIVQKT